MIRLFAVALLLFASCRTDDDELPPLTREQLLNPESCKDCHPKHYREWSASMHAYATKDPVFLAMNARGQRETKGELGDFCVKCHAPMAVAEKQITDLSKPNDVPEHLQGVTCYFCHNASGIGSDHFNANVTLANDNVMRAALDKPIEPSVHRVQYSEHHDPKSLKSSQLCGTCHDIKTPAPGNVRLERTLEEYQASIFAVSDPMKFASCQDCHMDASKYTVPAADSTGRPGEVVQARTVHEHLWPAVDVALTEFPHADAMRAAVESCRLRTSISYFKVNFEQGPGFPFVVTIETQAGHAQPSGAAQDRRMWLELIAYDASDKVVYRQGEIGDGAIEETADKHHPCMFRDRIRDASGKEVHMFWEAASYDSPPFTLPPTPANGTLVPGGHSQYCNFRPFLSTPPARIELQLRMRPMGIDVLQDLVASNDLAADVVTRMPTFTVASYEARYSEDDHDFIVRETSDSDCKSYLCMLDPSAPKCQ